jgi:hypothetical protein
MPKEHPDYFTGKPAALAKFPAYVMTFCGARTGTLHLESATP